MSDPKRILVVGNGRAGKDNACQHLATVTRLRFTGTTVLKVENGLITEEIGLDDGVTVLRQLGLITAA